VDVGDTLSSAEFDDLLATFNVQGQTPADGRYVIKLETCKECLVLTIEGMILQNITDEFEHRLEPLLAHHQARNIIIDLSKVTYISSAIMGFLHHFFEVATTNRGRVVLVKPCDKVRRMMALVGLYEYFVVLDTREMACEYHKNLCREERGEMMPPFGDKL